MTRAQFLYVILMASLTLSSDAPLGATPIDGLSPLYPRMFFGSPPQRLGKRQTQCEFGFHTCIHTPDTAETCKSEVAVRTTVTATSTPWVVPNAAQLVKHATTLVLVVNSVALSLRPLQASPTSCASGQYSCPATAGGGCCNIGLLCTHFGTSLVCGSTGSIPSATSSSAPGSGSSGLSTSAKTGIGVGIALGAILTVSTIAFIVVHRRLKDEPAGDGPDMSQISSAIGHQPESFSYDGPEPQMGPHSESANATTNKRDQSAMAVPINPDHPEHIMQSVELGSPARVPERYELHG
ncbi:MAG: hypothetical protein M1813_007205 [Trichoglossum hirsutum]|nr:MAG: hypothetical protein M1813_007205 [Trichoglossum hirsutum]